MRPAAVESSRINLVFSVKMKIVNFVIMRQPLLSLRLITIICGMSEIVSGMQPFIIVTSMSISQLANQIVLCMNE